jgi:Na+-translocating ferredoxin:NAD+ oxidoreductase subunit G
MREILKLSVSLFVIALFSGFAVGLTFRTTREKIDAQLEAAQNQALAEVMPEGAAIEIRSGTGTLPETYWVALEGSTVVAYAFEASARGYSSDIRVMAGVDTTGTILGVSVLAQNETPGLGTRIAEVPSKKYLWDALGKDTTKVEPWFTEQFEGLDINERIGIETGPEWHELDAEARARLEQRNGITAITGATISSKAVRDALQTQVYEYVRTLRGGESR